MVASSNHYKIGNMVRITGSFRRTVDGLPAAADPEEVVIKSISPSGVVWEFVKSINQLQNPEVGSYYVDFLPDEEGPWDYRVEGEGVVQAAAEGRFIVDFTRFEH